MPRIKRRLGALVRQTIDELDTQRRIDSALVLKTVSEQAGIAKSTIKMWRAGVDPHVSNLEAVLAVLGYRLSIVPIDNEQEEAA